jgi:hypothetical protein
VGIEERSSPALKFRAEPRGKVRLPPDVVREGAAFDKAFEGAIERGDAKEDHSQGHALMHDPATRAIQERFIVLANTQRAEIEEVLRNSGDRRHRALAALVLGYADDKQEIVDDLTAAMTDPDEDVRNNATRALWVIADFARQSPGRQLRASAEPFVDLLNSVVWSDRNKSSLALMELSSDRDPALMAALRTTALASITEMAKWKSAGHAVAAVVLLGRAAGLPADLITKAASRGDHATVIDAALKALTTK